MGSLSILDGCLHLYAAPDLKLDTTDLKPRNGELFRFNNDRWHEVSILVQVGDVEHPYLQLMVDGEELPYVTSAIESQEYENLMIDNVFFGGIPSQMDTTNWK